MGDAINVPSVDDLKRGDIISYCIKKYLFLVSRTQQQHLEGKRLLVD